MNGLNRQLEENFICAKLELENTKLYSKRMEKKFKEEQKILSNKYKHICQKLIETEIAFDEAKSIIHNDITKIITLMTNIKHLNMESGKN